SLRDREAERRDELREQVELLEELRVELAPRLVAGERLVPIGRHRERVPGDEHRPRLLGLPEPDEHVREADDRAGGTALGTADRLRERVVGAVRERVAVDCEERPGGGHSAACSRSISSISRRVVSCGSSPASTGAPYATRTGPSRASRSVPFTAAGTSGTPASRAILAAPLCGRASHF